MLDTKSQNSNMLLAFLTLTGVIAIVALVGFFMLRKGPEIVQGQAEVTEYRVSSKVPGRILEFRVKEGQSVQAVYERPRHICRLESDQDYRPVRPENIRSKSRSAREGGRTASGNECCIEEVKEL